MMDEVEERYPLVGNRPNNFGMETGNGSGTRRRGNGIESSKSEVCFPIQSLCCCSVYYKELR